MKTENTWPTEYIPDEDYVYRQVHIKNAPKINGKRIPDETNFIPDEDGLSVHWDKYTTINDVYCVIGLSHNMKGGYKDYTGFKVFQFPVTFLRRLQGISGVIHTPVINGNPAPIGHPNNRAHASVILPNDEEIRIKLTDHVINNYINSYCDFDVTHFNIEIKQLRNRLNDTPYHIY